jgi:hypothetical protein
MHILVEFIYVFGEDSNDKICHFINLRCCFEPQAVIFNVKG